mgnify:CR=1 FL=1
MMGSEVQVGLKHVQRQGRQYGAGNGARTRDLRMSQTFQGLSRSLLLCRYPMSPTRHQLRHPGNEGVDLTKEYEYIHSSRPFV